MALKHFGPIVLAFGAMAGCPIATAWCAEAPAIRPGCLAADETREQIKARHLLEPFAVLKSAAAQLKAEALKARLCVVGDDFVYEITLLHRDGRLMHVVMNAITGKILSSRNSREPGPKT